MDDWMAGRMDGFILGKHISIEIAGNLKKKNLSMKCMKLRQNKAIMSLRVF